VGYAGGSRPEPTYHSLGDHTESLQIDYDPEKVSYAELLEVFWTSHHPAHRPYSRQYMSAIFYADDAQRRTALESRDRRAAFTRAQLFTELSPLKAFYRAEDYHQKYYLRGYADLVGELSGYTEAQLEDSTVAARLNGYVGGDGTPEQLEAELAAFGLSEAAGKKLRALVKAAASR
jgi:peptide-methionine (S)-S-oxide reductase